MPLGGFRAGQPFRHRGQFFAPRHHVFLHRLKVITQLREGSDRLGAFRFRSFARAQGFAMILPRFFSPLSRGFRLRMQTGDFFALGGELRFDAA